MVKDVEGKKAMEYFDDNPGGETEKSMSILHTGVFIHKVNLQPCQRIYSGI